MSSAVVASTSSSSITCLPCSNRDDNKNENDCDQQHQQQQEQQQRRRRKKSSSTVPPTLPPPLPTDWSRCHFYMPQKRRYCRQEPLPIATVPPPVTNGAPLDSNNANNPQITAASVSRYCGNHQPLFNSNEVGVRQRIPCPFDKSHSIYQDQLDQHSRICPAFKKDQAQRKLDCYQQDINTGGHGSLAGITGVGVKLHDHQPQVEVDSSSHGNSSNDNSSFLWAKQLALRVMQVSRQLGLLENENSFCSCSSIPLVDLATPSLMERMEAGASFYNLKSGGPRHLHQQASLVGHVLKCIKVGDERVSEAAIGTDTDSQPPTQSTTTRTITTILEVGAGRGMTGLMAAGIIASTNPPVPADAISCKCSSLSTPTTRLIMVDRGGSRSKADTVLRRAKSSKYTAKTNSNDEAVHSLPLNLGQIDWCRVTCDIKDVDMRVLLQRQHQQPEQHERPQQLVLLAKHLCGSGTDLALASLKRIRNEITACVLATCCHGLCTWDAYVGRDHLAQVLLDTSSMQQEQEKQQPREECQQQREQVHFSTFGRPEFELLCRWSAGTVSCRCARKKIEGGSITDRRSEQLAIQGDNTSSVNDFNDSGCDHDDNVDTYDRNKRPIDNSELNPTNRPDNSDSFNIVKIAEALQLDGGPSGLGRACQRLIDYGRREFLRESIFQAAPYVELLHYVPASVTPQNAVLVATKIA